MLCFLLGPICAGILAWGFYSDGKAESYPDGWEPTLEKNEVVENVVSQVREMLEGGMSTQDIRNRICSDLSRESIQHFLSKNRFRLVDSMTIDEVIDELPQLIKKTQVKLWREQGEQRKIAQFMIKECVYCGLAQTYIMSSLDMEKVFLYFITKLQISFWEQDDDVAVLKKEIKKAIQKWKKDLPNHADRIDATIRYAKKRMAFNTNIILRITENPLVWRAIYKGVRGGFQEFKLL